MPTPKLNPEFVVQLPIKNERGDITGYRDFVTYPGLLALAHELGLEEINTTVLQMPTDANGHVVVVRAVAKGKPGLFTGLGDASPANTNRRVAPHAIRVAETRAKARALRDLTNVRLVAIEELAGDEAEDVRPKPMPAAAPTRLARVAPNTSGLPITDAQRRALWRKASDLGHQGAAATAFVRLRLGIDPERATREQASRLLDALEGELNQRGGGHAAG